MKRWRYAFSRMLTDEVDVGAVREYVDRLGAEHERHRAALEELESQQTDLIEALRAKHKAPRRLTVLLDPSHLAEHGVVFLASKEAEEYEVPDDSRGHTVQ